MPSGSSEPRPRDTGDRAPPVDQRHRHPLDPHGAPLRARLGLRAAVPSELRHHLVERGRLQIDVDRELAHLERANGGRPGGRDVPEARIEPHLAGAQGQPRRLARRIEPSQHDPRERDVDVLDRRAQAAPCRRGSDAIADGRGDPDAPREPPERHQGDRRRAGADRSSSLDRHDRCRRQQPGIYDDRAVDFQSAVRSIRR
ncbi:MAG: hypothetical protein M5U28_00195 [Sandaracinaceae bacterium]|nr:hypothetical protein [Sandaracinaceae bacterium]